MIKELFLKGNISSSISRTQPLALNLSYMCLSGSQLQEHLTEKMLSGIASFFAFTSINEEHFLKQARLNLFNLLI